MEDRQDTSDQAVSVAFVWRGYASSFQGSRLARYVR
jgi:hypothetical protein